jgi:transcriptional regulator with XRE-family HTH domain
VSKPTFGARVRLRREEMDLSLRQLAEATGLSFVGIWQFEKDRALPNTRSLYVLARTFKARKKTELDSETVWHWQKLHDALVALMPELENHS